MNIMQRLINNDCGQLTSNCTNIIWHYYADYSGTMITFPYYNNSIIDPMYEDDQCKDSSILYEPRIKPVSMLAE